MNVFNIKRAFELKKRNGWPFLYWCVDLHDTIIVGKHNRFNEGRGFCPNALRVLTWLDSREDMKWILHSCAHDDALSDIALWLEQHGVAPNYINSNPECENGHLCDFSKKFYYDIFLDDKASFECHKDWFLIEKELKKIGEWQNPPKPPKDDELPPAPPVSAWNPFNFFQSGNFALGGVC